MAQHDTLASTPKRLLRPTEVATIYGIPATMLERMRREGRGPAWAKTSRARTAHVFYRVSDVEAWIESRLCSSTSETSKDLPG